MQNTHVILTTWILLKKLIPIWTLKVTAETPSFQEAQDPLGKAWMKQLQGSNSSLEVHMLIMEGHRSMTRHLDFPICLLLL